MPYHPPASREPSGCLQTLVITRMIFQILAIPIAMIVIGLVAVILFLYAFTQGPLIALGVIVILGLIFYGLSKWEQRRIQHDLPPEN